MNILVFEFICILKLSTAVDLIYLFTYYLFCVHAGFEES